MSLDDPVFADMFHGDGSVRVPGKCLQCAEESSDVEEDLCRTCLPDMHQSAVFGDSVRPTSGEVLNWDRRKRLRPEDEDTTDEEFGAQPEGDDTTQEEELYCLHPVFHLAQHAQ